MISVYTDYDWVDVADVASYITGDILPVRMKRNTGAEKLLRYEDYLFLLEALYERANWSAVPSASVTPAGRTLNRAAMGGAAIAYDIYGRFHDFVDRDFVFPIQNWYGTYTNTSVQAALGIQNVALEEVNLSFGQIPDLNLERICKMFWNVKQCKRTLTQIPIGDIATMTQTATYVKSDGSTGPSDVYTGDWNGNIYNSGAATRVGSENERCSIVLKQPLVAAAPYATSATLFMLLYGSTNVLGSSSSPSYGVVKYSCGVSNGVISTPNFTIDGLAQRISSATNVPYNPAPYYHDDGKSYGMGCVDAALVVEHDFPTEIDSVGWNWSPPQP